MEWRNFYLDLILVPSAILSSLFYHVWLWYTVKRRPDRTYIAMNAAGQSAWINHILTDNDKKNVLAIQTLRNNIMGATLTATTSVLICCGLLAFASKDYDADKPDKLKIESKCSFLLLAFLSVFLCQTLSIACLTQVNILINILAGDTTPVRRYRVTELLGKGIFLCNVGNRVFFSTLPLVLWIFGPVLVFVCSVGVVVVLYSVDVVGDEKGAVGAEGGGMVQP
ncbi:uncharacterized protein A4U43_C05F7710 [Asparagus officinalis]|uniref:DUF599 domain-containing protein n=1 Tax=Asparagus officinalis TaxID=4686 RepID=A0A5P1EQB4_ASPOF|nr:uncharacterized protein LOC109843076 [Asparagus officinalis]ONK68126.1 uncharacterized protein A4U43_C05F7710 [Asparagus officinalis]